MCALFDTLIGDADGIYDPSLYNDRLLLGLKGTMSEAEIHILKARMLEGRRAKAQRGELVLGLPRGYVLKPSGEVALDPDEEVQEISVWSLPSSSAGARSAASALSRRPRHPPAGPHPPRAAQRRRPLDPAQRADAADMLRNPLYAGAYVYGRRTYDGRLRRPGQPHSGKRFLRDPKAWKVLHRGARPAYIDWDTFERNQEQMAANRARHTGLPRGGPALLGGLVACGLCGRRMCVTYNDDGREARYACNQMATTYGAPQCQSISARPVDEHVSALMLEALSPSAIEVSLQVAEDLEWSASNDGGTGSSGWNGRTTRRSWPAGAMRRSTRPTALSPAPWSGIGRRRWRPTRRWRASTSGPWPTSRNG